MARWQRSAAVAGVAAVLAAGCARASEQQVSAGRPGRGGASTAVPDVITALVASALAAPEPVLGADDQYHVAYELFATNASSSDLAVTKVEILDPTRKDKVLSTLEGAALQEAVKFISTSGPTAGPATVFRIMLDQTFADEDAIPTKLAHRITYTLTANGTTETQAPVITGRTDVGQQRAILLAPPLEGARWWDSGGCCFPPSYHRTATLPVNGAFHAPERYAIDFIQLQADNQLLTGPKDQLASYPYYGAHILAARAGTVVRVMDGLPDNVPGTFPPGATAETAGGNYAVIDMGKGYYAFYAHLQPGTLTVAVGDHVKQGQVLGLLGNSGNSDAPHLHFHVMDGEGPLSSNGRPYRFTNFTVQGKVTNRPDDVLNGDPVVLAPEFDGPHRRQLPLDNELLDFASVKGGRGDVDDDS